MQQLCAATHTDELFTVTDMTGELNDSRFVMLRDKGGGGDVPLDLNALSSVYVVAFSVCGKVLGVGRGSRLKILGILGQFQPFGFLP